MIYPRQRTLAEIIEESQDSPLQFDHIVKYSLKIATELKLIYRKNILFCNVTPSNILINNEGQIEISFNNRNIQLNTIDSFKYTSPEQIQGIQVDARSDIWSVGIIIYEMVTGVTPFTGANIPEITNSIISKNYKAPNELRQDIPEKLLSLINKALSIEINDRYQNIVQLINDLKLAIYQIGYSKLLMQLDIDVRLAEKRLLEIRNKLVTIFRRIKELRNEAEDLANKTIDDIAYQVALDKVLIQSEKPEAIFRYHAHVFIARPMLVKVKEKRIELDDCRIQPNLDKTNYLNILISCCEKCVRKLIPVSDQDRFLKYIIDGFKAKELLKSNEKETVFRTRMFRYRQKIIPGIEECLARHGIQQTDFLS